MENNIVWQNSKVNQNDRRRLTGQKPMILWFTGLSGSGKSTIAEIAEKALNEQGYLTYMLDGDNIRHGLNSNLGFSDTDRAENIRRIAETAKLMADSGIIVLVSVISPMANMRTNARNICKGYDFVEIYVKADIRTCIKRDPKGLYKKATKGEIKNFTGIGAVYEEPINPELVLDTEIYDAERCANDAVNIVTRQQIDFTHLLEVSIQAAIKAGEAIMEVYNSDIEVEYKADDSPLTKADKVSNDIISESLKTNFPYYALLTEESKDDRRRILERYCFIVDPLDGTKEFIKHNGEFTVNIALSFDGESIMGVIYVPVTKTLYFAYKGGGAHKAVCDGDYKPIHVSSRTDDLVVMESRSHGDNRLEELLRANNGRIAKTITSGSSLKGCLIAEGTADIYYRYGYTMEWDTAAMQCICEEAGAYFRQGDDTPLMYNRRNSLNDKGFYILNKSENDLKKTERKV